MFTKCSTAQSFIRTEMTTYRIGTLGQNENALWRTRLVALSLDILIGQVALHRLTNQNVKLPRQHARDDTRFQLVQNSRASRWKAKQNRQTKKATAHSGRYGHNNETLILQNFAFNMQFYTYFNPYDVNQEFKNGLSHLIW